MLPLCYNGYLANRCCSFGGCASTDGPVERGRAWPKEPKEQRGEAPNAFHPKQEHVRLFMTEIPLILFGIGGVGRALVRQILDCRQFHAEQYALSIRFRAICDSRSAIIGPEDGLDDAALKEILALKTDGKGLKEHPLAINQRDLAAIVEAYGKPGAIVVDCTATEHTVPALLCALEHGYKVVLANKKPLTVAQEVYDRLTRADNTASSPRDLAHTRWEATVGAGLPVIAAMNRLVASGDEIHQVTGTFSGTLGYVMTGLQEGHALSEIVRQAYERGYTEPDPRDDLAGLDVARKALILARGLGWRLDLTDVDVTGLYPSEMDDLSVPEFIERLPELDTLFYSQVAEAAEDGKVLRYAATIANGTCRVGLTAVERSSPLGRLTGTDNLVEITSRWYSPNPLVIQGRGAGVDATAAGVLSDIVDLAFTAT